MPILEERVDHLEEALMQLAYESRKTDIALQRLSAEMKDFKEDMKADREKSDLEMKTFREEMKAGREKSDLEMKAFREEMKTGREKSDLEMKTFREEMKGFKNEMLVYREETRKQRIETNMQWGKAMNKLGTMVEDLVAPSLPRIVKQFSSMDDYIMMVRYKKFSLKGDLKEWDALLVSEEFVFVNSTKSSVSNRDVNEFIRDLEGFRDYFPQYKKNRLIGILASLYVDNSVIKFGEKKGLVILSVGEEIMEIKNSANFKPKEW